ncbi:MAG TPA: PilN domain-containing protein [Candidatus Paceibacterota bacterium]|nr:PilN domain-containing protein [Candidatus Paceibacterota bacterium]
MAQYTETANDRFLKDHISVGWPWRMFILFALLFTCAVIAYAGLLFGYKPYVASQIIKTENELESLSAQISPDEQRNFVEFYSQISNLKGLLAKHVLSSKLLPLIEGATDQKVVYTSTNFTIPDRTLKIQGYASSYEVLAGQLALYENSPWVERVVLDDSSTTDKTVKFTLRITFKNETINL